jgi:hypothetical protein
LKGLGVKVKQSFLLRPSPQGGFVPSCTLKAIFFSREALSLGILENVEQAPSPALLKNSRGRLFYISLSSWLAKIVNDSLAFAGTGWKACATDFYLNDGPLV